MWGEGCDSWSHVAQAATFSCLVAKLWDAEPIIGPNLAPPFNMATESWKIMKNPHVQIRKSSKSPKLCAGLMDLLTCSENYRTWRLSVNIDGFVQDGGKSLHRWSSFQFLKWASVFTWDFGICKFANTNHQSTKHLINEYMWKYPTKNSTTHPSSAACSTKVIFSSSSLKAVWHLVPSAKAVRIFPDICQWFWKAVRRCLLLRIVSNDACSSADRVYFSWV